MMPLLFPYTFISDSQAENLLRTFGSLGLFSASGIPMCHDTRIRTLVPVSGDGLRFESAVRAYRQFAADTMELAGAFLKGQSGIPLFDPDSSAAIRSDVRKCVAGGPVSEPSENLQDRLLRARVFLEIARDYDEKKVEIEKEFEALARRESLLLEQLKGDDLFDERRLPYSVIPPDSSQDTHMALRLSAWADLFLHAWPDTERGGEGFFLTTSQEALDRMHERVPEMRRICDVDCRAMSSEEVSSRIRDLLRCDSFELNWENNRLDSGKTGGNLSLHVAPHVAPWEFFSRLTDIGGLEEKKKADIRNTVIGFYHEQVV